MKPLTRQEMFCLLKNTLIHDETFGLFMADKAQEKMVQILTPPFDIELVLEFVFGVTSCGNIKSQELMDLLGKYEEWRENNG